MRTIEPQQALPLSIRGDTREIYARIRNYLAGQFVGATRDEALVEEVVKCVFCAALIARDENESPSDPEGIAKLYRRQLSRLKTLLPDLFEPSTDINLDPTSLRYVHEQLRDLDFLDLDADPIGDAYEAFIGSATRGAEGQFFTPQNAVRLLVEIVDPQPGEKVIDPACGAGGFLSYTAKRLLQKGTPGGEISQCLVGIDKDKYLSRLAQAHVGLVTLSRPRIYCGDSLAWAASAGTSMLSKDEIGSFDVVLANPPFGARIVAATEDVQRRFALGHTWKRGRDQRWNQTAALQSRVSPQILFVERLLSLVRPGGRVGVVLPESLISGKSYRHVVQHMRDVANLTAVIGMPEDLFKTSGKGGTHTKVCLLVLKRKEALDSKVPRVFFAEAEWCGNDSRGRSIARDELPEIAERFKKFAAGRLKGHSHLGYQLAPERIHDGILAPRYYDPNVDATLERLAETHDLVPVQRLLDHGVLEIGSGHEVGKLAYGSGAVPFVRTSDISNWEIKLDPKHSVSEELYNSLAAKQDVRAGDILMVRDGTYLIGTCALVTEYDTKIVFQSHLYKLRIKKPDVLSPYLLLAALSSEPVQLQIQAKRFTQDIIDSLGDRIAELVLPLPKSKVVRDRITEMVKKSISERVLSRELARRACRELVATDEALLPTGLLAASATPMELCSGVD